MTQPNQTGERKHMKKTPKQKTSIYIDKEHLQTIQEMKDKYNLSVNRTINLCLKNYLPEIQEGKCVLWIWSYEWSSNKRPMDSSRHRWTQTEILRLVGWYSWPTWRWTESQQQSWEAGKLHFRIHDVILSDPDDKGDAQDLYVTIEQVESAGGWSVKDIVKFELSVLIEKNKSTNERKLKKEMLKHVHDLKKDLREKGWCERETPEVSQTSFLRSENSDAELGFKFEWIKNYFEYSLIVYS